MRADVQPVAIIQDLPVERDGTEAIDRDKLFGPVHEHVSPAPGGDNAAYQPNLIAGKRIARSGA